MTANPLEPAPPATAELRGWLPTRTWVAFYLIGHGCALVFVLGMVTVLR